MKKRIKLKNKTEYTSIVRWEGPWNDAKDDAEMYCSECDCNIQTDDWNYCPVCGVKLLIHGKDIY